MKISTTCALALLTTMTLLVSCGPKDSDKIGDAQMCLDSATPATVSTCVDQVAGLETPNAYIIRCAANFIENGFSSNAKIVDTFSHLNSGAGSSTPAFLDALKFGSQSIADETFSNCSKTNQKGLSMLAALVKSATVIASLGTGGDITSKITALLGTDPTSTEAQTSVGETVLSVYQAGCETGSQVNQTVCDQLTTALATLPAGQASDPQKVGAAILAQWKTSP